MAKQYQGLGMTPEEITELVKAREEAERGNLEKKGEWDKLKAQLLESHKKEITAREEAVQKMKSTLESYLVDASATEAIASAKGYSSTASAPRQISREGCRGRGQIPRSR